MVASHFGLDAVWGDRRGALSFRRCLLSPSLTSFGAARYDDTCVLWTGKDYEVPGDDDSNGGQPFTAKEAPQQRFDAVCFPPPGLVPLQLVEGRKTPWTIMPNSTQFQPTSATKVRVWRVRIERDEKDRPVNAVRLEEVAVNGFAVDCSTKGEPFCVIYWPDLELTAPNTSLEVQLTGLCGRHTEITMFHELMSFRRRALDKALVNEAARIRSQYGAVPNLWHIAKAQKAFHHVGHLNKMVNAMKLQPKENWLSQHDLMKQPRNHSQHDKLFAGNLIKFEFEKLSHNGEELVATSDELLIFLRVHEAAVLKCYLHLKRFAGETAELPRSTQTQRLGQFCFLVRVKIPMPRQKYELRFFASSHDQPRTLHLQSFSYQISAAASCPVLLRSLEDKLMSKYGYGMITAEAQLNGLTVLSPLKYRVPTGKCYFLVIVDVERALSAARQALPEGLEVKVKSQDDEQTTLFSHRLMPEFSTEPEEEFQQSSREVTQMQSILRGHLASHAQDGHGEIHLDLLSHNGEHIQPLRERQDIPGLFEGILTVAEQDVTTQIQLLLRFPRIHAIDFSPRMVSKWLVCRADDHVPANF